MDYSLLAVGAINHKYIVVERDFDLAKEREIVYESLIEILENGRYSHIVEKDVLDKFNYLDKSKKAYIKRMIEGTVELLPAIDEVIDSFAKTKVKKQKSLIRTILRMGTYEILMMDSSPDYAIVSESVTFVKKHGFVNLAPFVNGILRNVSKNKENIKIEAKNTFPTWMLELLAKHYEKDVVDAIIRSSVEEHPVTIRVRNELEDYSGLKRHPMLEYAYVVDKGKAVRDIKGYDAGDFVVQDVSSMMVVERSGIKEGDTVLDVCAAPGGKSIHAYDFGARVTSRDVSDRKIDLIRQNLERCNINDVITEVRDATSFDADLEEMVDVLIADVPCSGLGVLAKKTDIKLKLKEEDLDSLVKLQWNIVNTVYKYVKVGKTLMYSTCTINPAENSEMVKRIIEELPFELIEERQFIQGVDDTDGFYYAKLRRISK